MKQPDFHLIAHGLCPYVQRSVITLEEKGIAYRRTDIDLAHKSAWFEQLSPLGKVPVLLINDRQRLFESAVICEYLDEVTPASLHPEDPLQKARQRSWIEFASTILNAIAALYNAADECAFDAKCADIQQRVQWLEQELGDGPFFAGDRFHLVDAVYAPVFRYFDVFESVAGLQMLMAFPKCQCWRAALRQRLSVQRAVAADYAQQLTAFLLARNSHLAQLIRCAA